MADARQAALPVAVLEDEPALAFRSDDAEASKPTEAATATKEEDDHLKTIHTAEEEEYRRDGGWRAWSTVGAGFLFMAICLGQLNSFGIYVAYYKFHEFPHASELSISFVGSSGTAMLVFGNFIAGRPCEVFGLRPVALAGLAVSLAGLIGASFCSSIPALIVTQGIIQGLGSGFLFQPGAVAPVPWFKERRAFAMGIVASGSGVGGLVWSYVIQACIDAYGFRWALRISALVTTAVIMLALSLMRIAPGSRKLSKAGAMEDSFKIFATEKWLIPYFCAFIIFNMGFYVPTFYLPSYLQTESGASASRGAAISAVLNAGNIVGRVGLGFFADRGLGIFNAFCLALLLAGILQLALWLPSGGNEPAAFAFAFLYGAFGLASIGISPAVLARHLDPYKLPSIGGIFFLSELPGFLSGAPISGAILARTNYRTTIGYAGSAMVIGGLLSVVARFMISPKILAKV